MKSVAIIGLIVSALLNVACVTEGVVRSEPASDEEVARANLALGISYIQENRPGGFVDFICEPADKVLYQGFGYTCIHCVHRHVVAIVG